MFGLISIIVPIYNTGERLRKCIDSIKKQTYKNIEVILIDDGSKDNSGVICDEISNSDNRFIVIHQENAGVSAARNVGINNAKGQYIMFVDADDYLDEKICEVLINFATKNVCDISIANKVFRSGDKVNENVLYKNDEIVRDGKEKELFMLDLFSSHYDKDMNDVQYLSCGVTGKLYASSIIKENNLFFLKDCHYGEDVVFNVYAYNFAKKIGYTRFNGYNYVINSDSSTHNYKAHWEDSHVKYVQAIENFLKENEKDSRFMESLEMIKATRIVGLSISYYFHPKNPKRFLERYSDYKKFINQPEYKSAIKNVKSDLLTKNQKMVLKLIRNKLSFILILICYLKNRKDMCK